MMHTIYSAAQERTTPARIAEAFAWLAEELLERGRFSLQALARSPVATLAGLVAEGYLETDPGTATPEYRLAAQGVRHMESMALANLLQAEQGTQLGSHASRQRGQCSETREESRPYQFGDAHDRLDLGATLRNALTHSLATGRVRLREHDLVIREHEAETSCATVLLLDRSGSMARYGKYVRAKQAILALRALIRRRFARDVLHVVGFATHAHVLDERSLVLSIPHSADLLESWTSGRVLANSPHIPRHFTNLQAGLRLARRLLQRHPAQARQIVCITDGEPTAHLEGDTLVLGYPPTEATWQATWAEVRHCRQLGIRLSVVALPDPQVDSGVDALIERLARLGQGSVARCSPGRLGGWMLRHYASSRPA